MTELPQRAGHREHDFRIEIDRTHHTVDQEEMTGHELRHLTQPPIPADRDLYEVRPGREDELVSDDAKVRMHDGLRFFTAPGRINPGQRPTC